MTARGQASMMRMMMLAAVHLAVVPLLVPNGIALYVCLHNQSLAVSGSGEQGCLACGPEDEQAACDENACCCQSTPTAPDSSHRTGCENHRCCVEVQVLDHQPANSTERPRSTPTHVAWTMTPAWIPAPREAPFRGTPGPDARHLHAPGPAILLPLLI